MKLLDTLIGLMHRNDGKRYLYVSDSPENLDSVANGVLAAVDLSKTDCLVYLVQPIGLDKTFGAYHGIFMDEGCCDQNTLLKAISRHDGAVITVVNPINGQIET